MSRCYLEKCNLVSQRGDELLNIAGKLTVFRELSWTHHPPSVHSSIGEVSAVQPVLGCHPPLIGYLRSDPPWLDGVWWSCEGSADRSELYTNMLSCDEPAGRSGQSHSCCPAGIEISLQTPDCTWWWWDQPDLGADSCEVLQCDVVRWCNDNLPATLSNVKAVVSLLSASCRL